jgi:hypothetical protein
LEQRVAALKSLLKHFSREGNEVFITGANLHTVNGLGSIDCEDEEFNPIPDCPNGLGNLIVGYNEPRPEGSGEDIRTGSHNVVMGRHHNFLRFGGLVVGDLNTISGEFASVSGGQGNSANGFAASISAGNDNVATGDFSSISGGSDNAASGNTSIVSGGRNRTAAGDFDWVAGSLFEDE